MGGFSNSLDYAALGPLPPEQQNGAGGGGIARFAMPTQAQGGVAPTAEEVWRHFLGDLDRDGVGEGGTLIVAVELLKASFFPLILSSYVTTTHTNDKEPTFPPSFQTAYISFYQIFTYYYY